MKGGVGEDGGQRLGESKERRHPLRVAVDASHKRRRIKGEGRPRPEGEDGSPRADGDGGRAVGAEDPRVGLLGRARLLV